MFFGRESEIAELEQRFADMRSQLVVLYGRRRIGKSELLKRFCVHKHHLFFEGLENERTPRQIQHVVAEFARQTRDPLLAKLDLRDWREFFDLLTAFLQKQTHKTVLVFDEFQWLAAGQSRLVSLLKYYWDNHWKTLNVMLVLCGSVAHFMVQKVIRSKALYGRINQEISLQGLEPEDARHMLKRRGSFEVLKYLMVFGAVPKYLEEIRQNQSFEQNINRLCFCKDGVMTDEVDKVFFSQFREARVYKSIVELLARRNLSLVELSKHLKIPSGGGLKGYLENLEMAGFIRSYPSIQQKGKRNQKYKLFDEFLLFYFKFMKPHLRQIHQNKNQNLFASVVAPKWKPWLGIAFEVFVLKQAMLIAEKAGFADKVLSFAPYFEQTDERFQIDLIYSRRNEVWTVCEVKFHESPVGAEVIAETERKIRLLKLKKSASVEKMLIAPFGAEPSLVKAEYFHHILSLNDLLK